MYSLFPAFFHNLARQKALDLVEMLKANTPATTVTYSRRRALEDVAQCLESFVYEEMLPLSLQASRVSTNGNTEYLIEWLDGMYFFGKRSPFHESAFNRI